MEPEFPLALIVPARGSRRLQRSLHEQLRRAILDGRLRAGTRLPPTRTLAGHYGIGRNTVLSIYDALTAEGYLIARGKAGTFVAAVAAAARPAQRAEPSRPAAARRLPATPRPLPRVLSAPPAAGSPLRLDFRLGVPDLPLFPAAIWQRLSARAWRALARQPAVYGAPAGQPALRAAIARHVSFTRAVACAAGDVIVTSGAQQAFDLLARTLVQPQRSVVALEDPGYPPARAAFAAAGARIVSVPVDAEGLVVERLPDTARVVYVTPSHQFPLGPALSLRRRVALLEFARRRGAVIIEDDYDGEFRFGGRPLDALQTLDRDASVFYVGTFSKSLFPALRLGFVIAPPWAIAALAAAKQAVDGHCPVVAQDALATFIDEGHMLRHVRRMHRIYAARRAALVAALSGPFAPWLDLQPGIAGLHVTALARKRLSLDALVQRARERGVGLHRLREYYARRTKRDGLIFGYGAIDEASIRDALDRLRKLLAN